MRAPPLRVGRGEPELAEGITALTEGPLRVGAGNQDATRPMSLATRTPGSAQTKGCKRASSP